MANFIEVKREDKEPSLRKRIAAALLQSSAPDPDAEVQSPWQAAANATHQIASAYAQKRSAAAKPKYATFVKAPSFKKPIFGG